MITGSAANSDLQQLSGSAYVQNVKKNNVFKNHKMCISL